MTFRMGLSVYSAVTCAKVVHLPPLSVTLDIPEYAALGHGHVVGKEKACRNIFRRESYLFWYRSTDPSRSITGRIVLCICKSVVR